MFSTFVWKINLMGINQLSTWFGAQMNTLRSKHVVFFNDCLKNGRLFFNAPS